MISLKKEQNHEIVNKFIHPMIKANFNTQPTTVTLSKKNTTQNWENLYLRK